MSVPDFSTLTQNNIVAFIGDIFNRRGAEAYIGEPVTISEHMLQGAELAEQADAGDLLIAGILLHDIGHFTNEFPDDAMDQGTDAFHEEAGARVLENFFPSLVTDCVRQHVAAKRYLCATDPDYFTGLSDASVTTLKLQGGQMNTAEIAEFETFENLAEILQVRIWDDLGKIPDHRAPPFEHYIPVLQRVVDRHLQGAA